MGHC